MLWWSDSSPIWISVIWSCVAFDGELLLNMWILYDYLFTVWLIATTLAEVFDLLVHIHSLLLGVSQRAY